MSFGSALRALRTRMKNSPAFWRDTGPRNACSSCPLLATTSNESQDSVSSPRYYERLRGLNKLLHIFDRHRERQSCVPVLAVADFKAWYGPNTLPIHFCAFNCEEDIWRFLIMRAVIFNGIEAKFVAVVQAIATASAD